MDIVITDGGRAAAGFDCSKPVGDSAVRAIAIAMERPYAAVHEAMKALAATDGDPDQGVEGGSAFDAWMAAQGWAKVVTMQRGEGTTVHLKADELPMGRLVVQISEQLIAVIDRVQCNILDWSRDDTRAVYAYWSK